MIRKLTIGSDHYFLWAPPEGLAYYSLTLGIGATLSIQWSGSGTAYTMALVRQVDTVTAVSADRKQLTCTWGSSGIPASWSQGDPEPAFLSAEGRGQFPVRVLRVVSNTVGDPPGGVLELAEAVPHNFAVGAYGCNLHWSTWTVKIPLADIGTSMRRPVLWTVTYQPVIDGYNPGSGQIDRGELAVVRAPFATGMNDAALLRVFPGLASAIPAGSTGWRDQAQAGMDMLVSRILPELPSGIYEDHLSGTQWLRAHALATVSVILTDLLMRGIDRSAGLEVVEAQLTEEIRLRLARREWQDTDSDGLIDAGESPVQSPWTGMVSSHVSDTTVMDLSDDPTTPDTYSRFRVTGSR